MTLRTRVVNRRKSKYDVLIARPSKWGNPFSHRPGANVIQVETREEAIAEYRRYLVHERRDLMTQLPELEGKRLGCYCAPQSCHGDVLIELLELYRAGGVCRVCGCTEYSACEDDDLGPCSWAEPGLCSHCKEGIDAGP